MAVPPPVVSVLGSQKPRYDALAAQFKQRYGEVPAFYARAPGRVNLIGEHIDYCGYAVLPMAIEQDIVIAVTTNNDHVINIANTDSAFSPYSCSTGDMSIDKSRLSWYQYFMCGYLGIVEHHGIEDAVGLNLVVDGTVPRGAGLSSSSAFVCCAALAVMHANGKQCTKLELAELCQRCERYIGTEGGGMDQSISFLAQPGTAKLIEFNPIRATDIILPDGAVFVISNCCVESNKAATSHFNIRVTECRLAAQILAKAKGLDWRQVRKLGDLQTTLGLTLKDMLQLVKVTLHEEAYSKQEVCDVLGVTTDELNQTSLNEKTLHVEMFRLYDRATHVYSEALRVLLFKETCDTSAQGALEILGGLMNESHASCRDQYDCSCEQLDTLTKLARECGALGSRLTGAGWGGCAVSLVPEDHVTSFLQQMRDGYYAGDPSRSARVEESLFATQPGGGACICLP